MAMSITTSCIKETSINHVFIRQIKKWVLKSEPTFVFKCDESRLY